MDIHFNSYSIEQYLDQLASREPVPGGGSAAALSAALGVGLIAMVANYSLGRKKNTKATEVRLTKIIAQANKDRQRLLELVSLDSDAYLKVSLARGLDQAAQKQAAKYAKAVPQEVAKICYKAINFAPFLVERGNPYLLSDVEVAIELLMAGFNGARVMVRVNS